MHCLERCGGHILVVVVITRIMLLLTMLHWQWCTSTDNNNNNHLDTLRINNSTSWGTGEGAFKKYIMDDVSDNVPSTRHTQREVIIRLMSLLSGLSMSYEEGQLPETSHTMYTHTHSSFEGVRVSMANVLRVFSCCDDSSLIFGPAT